MHFDIALTPSGLLTFDMLFHKGLCTRTDAPPIVTVQTLKFLNAGACDRLTGTFFPTLGTMCQLTRDRPFFDATLSPFTGHFSSYFLSAILRNFGHFFGPKFLFPYF